MINSGDSQVKPASTLADFQKLDLRVGSVEKAERKEGSDKLIRLTVNLGQQFGNVTILAGIASWYSPAKLKNKKYIFVTNLEPKKMMGEESQGMMLAADAQGECKLIPVDKSIPAGTVVR